VLGRVGHAGAALATLMVLSRHLDVAGVGLYGSYLALYGLLDVATDAGSGLALVRRVSARPERWRASLRAALRFRGISLALAAIPALAYALLDPQARRLGPWGLLAAASLLGHLPGTWRALLQIRLRFGLLALAQAGGALLGLAAVLALVAAGVGNPLVFLCATLASRALGNILVWGGGRHMLSAHQGGAREDVADPGFARESLTLGAGSLFREAYGRLDVLLLRLLVGAEAAGLYAPCRAAVNLALVLPSYLLTVALPSLAALARRAPAAFLRRCRRLALGLAAVAFPGAAATLPLVPWLLVALFGDAWLPAAPALRILAGAAALAWPGSVLLTGLVARGGAGDALRASALALAGNLLLNLALIPLLGLSGAALARLAAEFLMVASARHLLPRGLAPPEGGGSP